MVPYVRLSFYKHFRDGFTYIYNKQEPIEILKPEEKHIDDSFYKQYPEAYQYAMDLTERELMQAVQGMYHNLEIWA